MTARPTAGSIRPGSSPAPRRREAEAAFLNQERDRPQATIASVKFSSVSWRLPLLRSRRTATPDQEFTMSLRVTTLAAAIVTAGLCLGGTIAAADQATPQQAVSMVQKAVAAIKAEGADKAYGEISNPSDPFVMGDLYIAVIGYDGTLLAYGSPVGERVGNNVLNLKDTDGKEVVKERIELAKHQPTFWQSYKFINPLTKKIEPKQMYCERLNETVVCGGVYQ
jgi:cytochrome c